MPRALSPGRAVVWVLAAAWLAGLILLPPRPSFWLVLASGLPLAAVASWTMARRLDRTWPAFVAAHPDWHGLGLLVLTAAALQMSATHGVTTDGAIYFSQLRSLVFDRDLDIAAEFAFLAQPPRPHHFVPVGPTLLWAPLYLTVAAVDAAGRAAGVWPAPDDAVGLGLTLPYVRAALLSSLAIGALGIVAMHARLREEFPRGVAFGASLLITGATALWWYLVYEPAMTHAASFGFVALFVVAAARWVPGTPTTRQGMVLGALLGLAALTRPQEAVYGLFPAVLTLWQRRPWAERLRGAGRLLGLGLAGALPFILLQAAHGTALYGRYRFELAGEGGYLRFFDAHIADVLFSSWHGFLSWAPIAYVAVLGTVAYLRRDARWATAALAILGLMAWVNGAAQDWSGGWAFGGRRFTSVLVMLAPGLALVIEALVRRPLLALAPLVVAALWWNHLLAGQYTLGLLPKDEPVSFARLVRQQAELHTRSPYFYPFAFPANAWFAWREGLPIDRYDLLAPEPLRAALDLAFDRRVDRFLLDGWDAPGPADAWGPSWWIGGSPASLAVPLDLPAGRDVRIEILARTRFEEPVVHARLALVVNDETVGEFAAEARQASTHGFVVPASSLGRVWRAGYNRVAFVSRGVARVDPADTRPPGPLARRVSGGTWPVAIYRLRIAPVE
ncbi:MAG: hypothetical protein AB1635_17330 [Acidobacteriota bacterium]